MFIDWFGLFPFRSPLLREYFHVAYSGVQRKSAPHKAETSCGTPLRARDQIRVANFFSFPPATEMFHFTGCPSAAPRCTRLRPHKQTRKGKRTDTKFRVNSFSHSLVSCSRTKCNEVRQIMTVCRHWVSPFGNLRIKGC